MSNPEHKGNEPDFAAEWYEWNTTPSMVEGPDLLQRMYELGRAARPQDAPDVAAAYRAGLEAAAGAARNIVIIGAPEDSPFPEGIADAILHLPIPEKFGGGK